MPVGVVAGELSLGLRLIGIPAALREGAHIFIDSGAFLEMKTGTPPDFDEVMRIYESVADNLNANTPNRLYVVSPDKVGSQTETLERLAQYKDRLLALIETGCRVIVPIQSGAMAAREMLDAVIGLLSTRDFIAGIPSNKAAMPVEECATLSHHAFHVLGRVQRNPDQDARLAALRALNPWAEVTADANWLRSRLAEVSSLVREIRGHRENISRPFIASRTRAVTQAIASDAWGT